MKKIIAKIIILLWNDYLNEKENQIKRANWEHQGELPLIYFPPSCKEFIEKYLKPLYE